MINKKMNRNIQTTTERLKTCKILVKIRAILNLQGHNICVL